LKFTAVAVLGQLSDDRSLAPLEASLKDAGSLGPMAPVYTQAVKSAIDQIKKRATKQ